jgi:hypothetical protein
MNKFQAPDPGPTPSYVPANNSFGQGDTKDPYEGGRFKPKKKVNDPIFLVFFILQVNSSF